jgi:hypothetical protein
MNFYDQKLMQQKLKQMPGGYVMKNPDPPAPYPDTPPGPNTAGWPVYPKLNEIPKYNPMMTPDRNLAPQAMAKFNAINGQMSANNLLKAFDLNKGLAEQELKNNMNQNRTNSLSPLLSRGVSADSLAELTDRMNKTDSQQLSNFYQQALAQRFGLEDQNAARNMDLAKFNAQNSLAADQFNAGNLLQENRFGQQAAMSSAAMEQQDNKNYTDYWLEKYKTDKGLEGAQANADAIKKQKKGGLLGLGIGGIL